MSKHAPRTCKFCLQVYTPKSASAKFCSITCRNDAYKPKRAQIQRNNIDKKASKPADGKLACEICGLYYHRPINHARQVHGYSEQQYKEEFGYNRVGGVTSKLSKERSRDRVMENYEVSVEKNLLVKGANTRFKKGQEGLGTHERRPKAKIYKINQ